MKERVGSDTVHFNLHSEDGFQFKDATHGGALGQMDDRKRTNLDADLIPWIFFIPALTVRRQISYRSGWPPPGPRLLERSIHVKRFSFHRSNCRPMVVICCGEELERRTRLLAVKKMKVVSVKSANTSDAIWDSYTSLSVWGGASSSTSSPDKDQGILLTQSRAFDSQWENAQLFHRSRA